MNPGIRRLSGLGWNKTAGPRVPSRTTSNTTHTKMADLALPSLNADIWSRIYLFVERPVSLFGANKEMYSIWNDALLQAQWMVARFGRARAIEHAVLRQHVIKRVPSDTVFELLRYCRAAHNYVKDAMGEADDWEDEDAYEKFLTLLPASVCRYEVADTADLRCWVSRPGDDTYSANPENWPSGITYRLRDPIYYHDYRSGYVLKFWDTVVDLFDPDLGVTFDWADVALNEDETCIMTVGQVERFCTRMERWFPTLEGTSFLRFSIDFFAFLGKWDLVNVFMRFANGTVDPLKGLDDGKLTILLQALAGDDSHLDKFTEILSLMKKRETLELKNLVTFEQARRLAQAGNVFCVNGPGTIDRGREWTPEQAQELRDIIDNGSGSSGVIAYDFYIIMVFVTVVGLTTFSECKKANLRWFFAKFDPELIRELPKHILVKIGL